MKNSKLIFLAMIILVCLVSISAASAADDTTGDIIADANDDIILEESINDANLQDDEDQILTDYPKDFNSLDEAINGNNDSLIELDSDYSYTADSFSPGIVIKRNLTLNGKGHTLDGNHLTRIFQVLSDNTVTFKDVNFVCAHISGNGGAIYAESGSTVQAINCNFKENNATGYGGAIYGADAINCTFTNNVAINWMGSGGGAICNGSAINCTFINNSALHGGAIQEGNATGCTFTGNSANYYGGAIYNGSAFDCNFTENNCDYVGGALSDGNAINCTFINNSAQYGGAIHGGNATGCTFIANLANESGGAMINGFDEVPCNAIDCTFINNSAVMAGAICEGNAINCNFTENAAQTGGAIVAGNATGCTFTRNYAEYCGAIFGGISNEMEYSHAQNCTFINNSATEYGGAIGLCNSSDCAFIGNSAKSGGAIVYGSALDCSFINNSASEYGGAMYAPSPEYCNATDCTFINNSALSGGAIYNGSAQDSSFINNSATEDGGAIYNGSASNCSFISNSANEGGAMYNGSASNCTYALNTAAVEGTEDGSGTEMDESCNDIVPVIAVSDLSTAYKSGQKLLFDLILENQKLDGYNTTINVYQNDNIVKTVYALTGEGWIVDLNPGSYKLVLSIENSPIESVNASLTVNKVTTTITSKAVTAIYNNNKYLLITLKDAKGNALRGVYVTVTLSSAKKYKTDKNGQIKINVGKLLPKNYTAKIGYAGDIYYKASSTTAKVVVKKASPKLTAKAKIFKVKVKTKKYIVTLKNNKGKVMKKAKLTLKVGKKTYKATTNSKGKATFKITKLTKKGTYKAVIKYKGNNYYKKATKNIKIKIR